MPAEPQRVVDDLLELRSLTSAPVEGGPAQTVAGEPWPDPPLGSARLAWSEPWQRARDWLVSTFDEVPVDTSVDSAGNLWVTLRGASPQRVVVGSHLDSVPDGGWLDGALGVVAGAEVLRGLHRDGITPPVSVSVVDWADEEGARFGHSLFGSSAVSGSLDPDTVRTLVDPAGVSLADALGEFGVEVDTALTASHVLESIVAAAELHIEQGPILERSGKRLAALHAVRGVERRLVRLRGQAAHAGATPISMRRDPAMAAARMALQVRELGVEQQAFVTVGAWRAHPSVPTVVNATTEFSVDMRHLDRAVLDVLVDGLERIVGEVAADEGVEASIETLWSIDPVAFHPELVDIAGDVCFEHSGQRTMMASGPMHDAAELVLAGVPTVMMFAPSIGGVSHTHVEDTSADDLRLAVAAFDDLVRRTIEWAAVRAGVSQRS